MLFALFHADLQSFFPIWRRVRKIVADLSQWASDRRQLPCFTPYMLSHWVELERVILLIDSDVNGKLLALTVLLGDVEEGGEVN